MQSLVLSALVVVANILGVGMILPQVWRLGRGSAGGVSGAWIGVGIGLNGWWLALSYPAIGTVDQAGDSEIDTGTKTTGELH